MDVTCDQCGAEYEFDETLLGDKGATVKCSNCNHVFRVLGKKEPGRSGLKLRFASSGRIEPLGSLRELQQRVRSGEVTADDMLGRDGVGFRRLRDVPELSNFFAASRAQAPQQAPFQVSETSMPPNTNKDAPRAPATNDAKRTMLGVGPLNPHIPKAPRVPNVPGLPPIPPGPSLPPPAARAAMPSDAVTSPPASASATVPDVPRSAPTSNQPTAPGTRPLASAAAEPRPAPTSQAPTVQGSPLPASPLPYAGDGPAIARPLGNTPRGLAGVTAPTLTAPSQGPVKLYLAEDEAPPARATQGGSKIGLYVGLALLLGGAGFVGLQLLNKPSAPVAEPAPAASTPEATAAGAAPSEPADGATQPVVTQPNAQAPAGQAQAAAAGATPAAQPSTSSDTSAAAREAEKATSSSSASKSSSSSSSSKTTSSSKTDKSIEGSSSSSAAKDPSDYGGWVSRGDQLFSRGDLLSAQTAYENALNLRPSGSEAHSGLGFTLLANGKAKEAITHFDRAAGSGFAEAYIGLGDAYRKLGQKSNAVEAYEHYLERLPSGSKASYARTHIESLKGSSASGTSSTSATPREEAEAPSPGPSDYKPAGELSGSDENE